MKKNILIFGGNSFLAKTFINHYKNDYNIHPVYRYIDQGLSLNLEDIASIPNFVKKIDFQIDSILFFQGINPSVGARKITSEHFERMLKVNLITPTLILSALENKLSEKSSVVFFSSIAKRKGSYDPSYAAAKSGITGLVESLANEYQNTRFNIITLGLVLGSPVYDQMTEDFRKKHSDKMFENKFIDSIQVSTICKLLIENSSINRADYTIDGGYR